jgi:hypothetical protein
VAEASIGVGIHAPAIRFGHQLAIRSYIAERLAQVVSRDRDELLEVRVGVIQSLLELETTLCFRVQGLA